MPSASPRAHSRYRETLGETGGTPYPEPVPPTTPNTRLRAAREAFPSSRTPGRHASRDELAALVADRIARTTGREQSFDGNHLGKLERGVVRRPSPLIRAALCAVLDADERALGLDGREDDGPALPVFAERNGDPADSEYVDELRTTIRALVALDGQHGGTEVAPLALRSFRRAQRVLGEGHYRPGIERDLEAVTAELGELSGWLLFDAARYAESRQVNAEALTLARIAGDRSMEHFILSNQALASIHTGRDREALRISTQAVCGDGVLGRVRALFDVRAARALAGLDDSRAALDRFDRARSTFADGVTDRDPAWSWWFDERELAGHLGMIHAALHDPHLALPLLADAVERSEGREYFRWALYIHRANLLRALLRVESWAEAERVALDVAPMVGEVASGRTEGILTEATAPRMARRAPSSLRDVLDHIGRAIPQR